MDLINTKRTRSSHRIYVLTNNCSLTGGKINVSKCCLKSEAN